jgi:hypothetical protein
MFAKLFSILIFLLIGITVALLLFFAEDFSEKVLPVLMVGAIIIYIFLSWYFGYFVASQKPPLTLVLIGISGIIIAIVSGYYMGTAK